MKLFFSKKRESQKVLSDLYENLNEYYGSRRSAKEIIPLLLELIHPQSVIHVGCGVGSWLAVFKQFNVQEVLGIDVDFKDYLESNQRLKSEFENTCADRRSVVHSKMYMEQHLNLQVRSALSILHTAIIKALTRRVTGARKLS